MTIPEILAPAGSYQAFLAAVHNGCDAVYLGGKAYGARAYADNFDIETLERAVAYARRFGVKVYYTINTLFKEKEVDGLLSHVTEVLATGIDALIVQDLGILDLLGKTFPEAELHASTQMNCHSLQGVRLLATMGVRRVVLARELNMDEITYIGQNTDLELECFVHGALCYCYSGGCLMSSFLGGRSGNRGRCAQPCRLAYEGIIAQKVYEKLHVLSPKDIETLTILPALIDGGIHSFKIEGRMKSPEYVGLMTRLYRTYRDLYLSGKPYAVKEDDIEKMLQVFNRGDFSKGYYHTHGGRDMITFDQPKNQGLLIGTVTSVKGKKVTFSLSKDLQPGDCLEFKTTRGYHSVIIDRAMKEQGRLTLKEGPVTGSAVRRLKSVALSASLQAINAQAPKATAQMKAIFRVGQPAVMLLKDGEKKISVTGDVVQAAKKQALTREKLMKQLKKTGDYPITLEDVTLEMDEGLFMAVSQINALRREALAEFFGEVKAGPSVTKQILRRHKVRPKPTEEENITVSLKNWHQFETVVAYDVHRVYLSLLDFSGEQLEMALHHPKVLAKNTQVFVSLPPVLRHEKEKTIQQQLAKIPEAIHGFLVASMDGWERIKERHKPVVWDYGLNVMNQATVDWLMRREKALTYMPSLELKYGELKGLDLRCGELLVYGHVNVMTTANCVRKSLEGCRINQGHRLSVKDRKGMLVPVVTNCVLCYNSLYNGEPLYLDDKRASFKALGAKFYRYDFLHEGEEEIKAIMGGGAPKSYTRGHYNKGVE